MVCPRSAKKLKNNCRSSSPVIRSFHASDTKCRRASVVDAWLSTVAYVPFLPGEYTNKKPALRSTLRAGYNARGTTSIGVVNSRSTPGSALIATPDGPVNGGLPNTSRVACISHAALSFHRPQLADAPGYASSPSTVLPSLCCQYSIDD